MAHLGCQDERGTQRSPFAARHRSCPSYEVAVQEGSTEGPPDPFFKPDSATVA